NNERQFFGSGTRLFIV
uniref:Uncharacterized protein n=1 Tax=Sarcophilus harrisii TaxID=9305 RepID=A0A7N4PAU4_SARHA